MAVTGIAVFQSGTLRKGEEWGGGDEEDGWQEDWGQKDLGTGRFGDRKILGGIHIKLRKNHECLFPLVLMSED